MYHLVMAVLNRIYAAYQPKHWCLHVQHIGSCVLSNMIFTALSTMFSEIKQHSCDIHSEEANLRFCSHEYIAQSMGAPLKLHIYEVQRITQEPGCSAPPVFVSTPSKMYCSFQNALNTFLPLLVNRSVLMP